MKSSDQKEESDDKRKYVFFSNPDVIAKRAETSAITAQITRDINAQRQTFGKQLDNSTPVPTFDIKNLENLISYHPVQPCPFPVISAFKQKLALGDCTDVSRRTHNPSSQAKSNLTSSLLETNSTQDLYKIIPKMDYRRLKAPDVKIATKTRDFSGRENSISMELPLKCDIAAKECVHDKSDKTLRSGERVQRKLDFSSDGSSIINSESIEPLKAPNVSIASNLKKKEHVRDSSREKENRSKRLKKDDSLCAKRDESAHDQVKRTRSPRHISRKDAIEISNIELSHTHTLPKNNKPFHPSKSNDYLSTKLKDKNFVMSTAQKDNDKRQKSSINTQFAELTRENALESKDRISSNESMVLPWKVPDIVALRDNNIGILSNTAENKSKDICHSKQRPDIEDLIYKSDSDNRLKQDKSNITHKEQTKRMSDKNKISNNKIEGALHNIDSELLEDVGSASDTNSPKNRISAYPVSSMQSSKSKDSETSAESKQNATSARSAKTLENFKCTEYSAPSASTSTKIDEESYSQSIVTAKELDTNDDSDDAGVSTLPDALCDSRRISFRDGYSPQEFQNLTTPEKMKLISLRSKRRKYCTQNSDSEENVRCPKHKPIKSDKEQKELQMAHPAALHMQFQADLHLYDSVSDTITQIAAVEQCLCNTHLEQEQKSLQKVDEKDAELDKAAQIGEGRAAAAADNDTGKLARAPLDYTKKDIAETWRSNDEGHFGREHYVPNQDNADESGINYGKFNKAMVKVEVQTQTVNDMATQTDTTAGKQDTQNELEIYELENVYEECRIHSLRENEVPQLSLDSAEQFEDLDEIEKPSMPSKIRTMSEISLHETTSSIKTETGTEISISTRDVTFGSFNQYFGFQLEQLIRDENQRCNKIEELFKSKEKTLNDKTKKLVQLEEQKKTLKDTGQDSRSLRKKQRALILKLEQEKNEISRLKQLYVIASQERMLMLQKQKNLFNPQMSTKNILTKLKRSADSQSPRRLSGPMKGYDIRSNSSMSSMIDSDKSQHDQSQVDSRLQISESDIQSSKLNLLKPNILLSPAKEGDTSATKFDDSADSKKLEKSPAKSPKKGDMSTYELRSRRYEEKMPRADVLRQKQNQLDIESKRIQGHPMKIKRLLENQETLYSPRSELNVSAPDYVKSESDTLVEELSKRSRVSQIADPSATISTEKETTSNIVTANSESVGAELKTSSKRKSSKHQETKSSSNTFTECLLQSKSSSHISEELVKHHDKRTRVENDVPQLNDDNESSVLGELDLNESQNSLQALVKHINAVKDKVSKLPSEINDYESKENVYGQAARNLKNEGSSRNERSVRNVSASQVNAFAISHHSSGESEINFSKSVVVRSEDRDFEQILSARETALARRKNCVEEWMAWHARLRAEEDRVSRMEQAAFKLVATASNVLSQQDTTISSDTSDVEGRIGLLTEKLAERRVEMARLKREAKRQAKKQLRALEANLLNQLERYDTTIHEMRKKLETKRAIKGTDKLAIEPKSLADFKVPEIPLKRIQDIYKSSDLLRSRSESDLLSTKIQPKDPLKIIPPATCDEKHERSSSQKSTKSADIKSANASESKGITDTNHSSQTIFEEYTSTEAYEKSVRTATSVSSVSNTRSGKYALPAERRVEESGEMKQSSVSRDAEDSRKASSTAKSELEVQTVSHTRSEGHSASNVKSTSNRLISNVDRSRSKSSTIQSEIQEVDVDCSKSIPSKKSGSSTENAAHVTVPDSNILSYSRKLDFLQLNNKNLSEDISSIENDIKALSEIMSRLSNESNEKSKGDNQDERNTSQDISEMISKSIFSDKVSNIASEEKQTVSPEREINIESLSVSANDRRSKPASDASRGSYTSDRISGEISAIIPEEVPILSNSAHEIDFEARSKEIMNEVEKSILSEHIKGTREDYSATSALESGSEELLNNLASKLDIKSISEILSKVSESRRGLDLATGAATQIISDTKEDADQQDDLDEANLKKGLERVEVHSLKLSELSDAKSVHSPIIAGHRSKEIYKANLQGDLRGAVPSQTSHALISENLQSPGNIPEMSEVETSIASDTLKKLDDTVNLTTLPTKAERDQSRAISAGNVSQDKDDWTTSDSFEVPRDEISTGEQEEHDNSRYRLDDNSFSGRSASHTNDITRQEVDANLTSDVDVSAFVPKGESTNVEVRIVALNDTLAEPHVTKSNDELDDILDIIARENKQESTPDNESEKFGNVISDSMAELLDKVTDFVESDARNEESRFKGILNDTDVNVDQIEAVSDASILNSEAQVKMKDTSESDVVSANVIKSSNREEGIDTISLQAVSGADDKPAINVNLRVEIDNEESPREAISEAQEIIITELDTDSIEDNVLSELEIDAKVELAEEEEFAAGYANEDENHYVAEKNKDMPVEIIECLESILEQDSSDGEQLDNLVEVAESGLDTVEKLVAPLRDSPELIVDSAVPIQTEETDQITKESDEISIPDATRNENLNKTFDILKDPEYEDISEESFEVSEILDKNDPPKSGGTKKPANLPEKYRATHKSEEVLRILDEISQKSSPDSVSNSQKSEKDAQSATEEISELLGAEVSAEDDSSSPGMNRMTRDEIEKEYEVDESGNRALEGGAELRGEVEAGGVGSPGDKDAAPLRLDEHDADDKSSQIIYELRERVSQLQEQDGSSESSEAGDTPRGVSEIEMDSPRDFNDSRLDIDILDDDLLGGAKATKQSVDVKSNFHSASIVATSEKDIEAMIDKLKASLGQPGLEVSELEAKLLRIEQLQIELEIKKLEAEEVSYYVREIPNKPPPPYTPPGDGRLSTSLGSPSLVTAVIPSNVEELTSFTEKATTLIYNAKLAGEDIASLEAPAEIYDLTKDKSEAVRKDRRIYNTFLFDLCKETIVEVYRAEYEKPGPSWTKPNVKTKPTMKIPKTVEELIEYVSKEVATLFGFKTKLQRENMVMRWSRKRRDRVDELLAREAQAEEDEWTKFHHDELAVKNGLTSAILDTIMMESTNVVKVAYGKKRRMMV